MSRRYFILVSLMFLLILSCKVDVYAGIAKGAENMSSSWQNFSGDKLKLPSGVTGADLVELAKSFQGFDYDYGGKTLSKTNGKGLDCAAFCCRMTAGLTTNDRAPYFTTSGFRSASEGSYVGKVYKCVKHLGRALTASECKIGWIVVSSHHAAIYAGNGKTIEASCEAENIRLKNWEGNKYYWAFEVKGITYDNSPASSSNKGSDGSWCKVKMLQGGVGHDSGCTVCTLQLILQNSGELKENQLKGSIKSKTDAYKKFNSACASAGFQTGSKWIIGSFASGASSLCNSTWESKDSVDKKSLKKAGYNSTNAIVGLGKKAFKDMTHSEQATAMKVFWNSGYFVVFCVEYKGLGQESNGPSGYKAAHATMLAGVKGNKIYLNDPAKCAIVDYSKTIGKGHPYNLMYVELFKNSATSPLELSGTSAGSGGSSDGKVDASDEDIENADNLGISMAAVNGYYSEEELSSYIHLGEVNIQDMFIDNAVRDNLGQNDLSSLANWERNINSDIEEMGVLKFLRTATALFGIALTVWSILVYVAYWFDRLNNFFDINLLGIFTFGKLRISEDENESTFSAKALGSHTETTVNHKNILFVAVLGVVIGALISSGVVYSIILGCINWVTDYIVGGGG